MSGHGYRRVALATGALAAVPLLVTGSSSFERTLTGVVVFALLATALNVAFGGTDQLFLFTGGSRGWARTPRRCRRPRWASPPGSPSRWRRWWPAPPPGW